MIKKTLLISLIVIGLAARSFAGYDLSVQDMARRFGFSQNDVCAFTVIGSRAIIQWKTYEARYGDWWTVYHTRVFDAETQSVISQSDY